MPRIEILQEFGAISKTCISAIVFFPFQEFQLALLGMHLNLCFTDTIDNSIHSTLHEKRRCMSAMCDKEEKKRALRTSHSSASPVKAYAV